MLDIYFFMWYNNLNSCESACAKLFSIRRMDMKRIFTIIVATVMILSAFTIMVVNVAAATDSDGELYLSDITPTSWKIFESNSLKKQVGVGTTPTD